MRHLVLALGIALLAAALLMLPGKQKSLNPTPADFDYYLLALSWAPNWCATTGDSRNDPECDKSGLTFTLHGLWPQYDGGGHPSDCTSAFDDPSRAETAAMADIMGSDSLARHEWQAHGRCSGLTAEAYFALMRKAYAAITLPPLFGKVRKDMTIAPKVVQDAFLESNPDLTHHNLAVTCDRKMIEEVRICLTQDLAPHPCGGDIRGCTMSSVQLDAVR